MQRLWDESKALAIAMAGDIQPVLLSVRMSPVNTSHGTGEVSSVLRLAHYATESFKGVAAYVQDNELILDIRKSLQHSLDVFE